MKLPLVCCGIFLRPMPWHMSISAFMGKYTGPHGPSDWYTAKSHCEALGQKLMTIDSPEEEDHVMEVLQPCSRCVVLE